MKITYKITAIIAVIFVFAFLVSCGENKKMLENFKYCIEADPQNLDPQFSTAYNSLIINKNIGEGLLVLKEDGTVSYGIAERYEISGDGLTYEFYLRKDAKWRLPVSGKTDYEERDITPDDFVFAFRRLFDTNSIHAENFYSILNGAEILRGEVAAENLGVKADGKNKLVITLKEENPMFLELLTTAPAFPCNEEFFLSTKGRYGLEAGTTASSGPFYLKEWNKGLNLILEKNEFYYSSCLPVEVSFEINPDINDVWEKFSKGYVDAMILTVNSNTVNQSYAYKSFENTVWGLGFNLKSIYLKNPDIRKALSLSMNLNEYMQDLPEYFKLAEGIIPPSVEVMGESYRKIAGQVINNDFDVDSAKNKLRKGAEELKINNMPNLKIILPKEPDHSKILNSILQNWRKELGMFLSVETLESNDYIAALNSKNFDLAIISYSASNVLPETVFDEFTVKGTNLLGYYSEAYNNLLQTAKSQFDIKKRIETFAGAEKMLIDEDVFIPFYYQTEKFAVNAGISGLEFNPNEQVPIFKNAVKISN